MQRSMVNHGIEWEVVQVKDTITPGNARYNAALARREDREELRGRHRAQRREDDLLRLPHVVDDVVLRLPSAAGANVAVARCSTTKATVTRNYASYNPQVIRTDAFMLGVNGTTKGHRIAPVRSSSALVISSTNAQRDRIYIQQPPISAPGYSSQAFNPHVPHTVRTQRDAGLQRAATSPKTNDNNAWMAQLLLQGTNFVNFIGRYAYVGRGRAKDSRRWR